MPGREFPDGHVQRAADGPADRLIGPGLDLSRPPQALHRHRAERVEQDGLADPAEPGQHHAAFWAAPRYPFEHDLELGEFAVAAGQLWRALPRTRCIRVSHRIHGIAAYGLV